MIVSCIFPLHQHPSEQLVCMMANANAQYSHGLKFSRYLSEMKNETVVYVNVTQLFDHQS